MGPDPYRWPAWPASRLLFFILLLMAGNYLVQILVHALTQDLFLPVAAGSLLGIVLPCWRLARAGGGALHHDFHLDRLDPGAVAAAVAVAAAALVPTSVLAGLSARIHPIDPDWIRFYQEHLPSSTAGVAFAFVTVVAVVPLAEELLFRGLFYRLVRRVWGAWPAVIISALVFGLVHGEPWFLLGLVGLGVVLAYLYESTGSLAAPIIAHALHNGVSLSLMLAQREKLGESPQMSPMDWAWLAGSVVALAAMFWLLARRTRRLELDGIPTRREAPPPASDGS